MDMFGLWIRKDSVRLERKFPTRKTVIVNESLQVSPTADLIGSPTPIRMVDSVPVSITMRNLHIPLAKKEGRTRGQRRVGGDHMQLYNKVILECYLPQRSSLESLDISLPLKDLLLPLNVLPPSVNFSSSSSSSSSSSESSQPDDGEDLEIILFSYAVNNGGSIHPLWDRFDERLEDVVDTLSPLLPCCREKEEDNDDSEDEFEDSGGEVGEDEDEEEGDKNGWNRTQLWNRIYGDMRIRVKISHSVQKDQTKSEEKKNTETTVMTTQTLADTSLHPTLLRRLPRNNDKNYAKMNNNATEERGSIYCDYDYNVNAKLYRNAFNSSHGHKVTMRGGRSETTSSSRSTILPPPPHDIPHILPPNSIIIRYSDGLVRVLPELYRYLIEAQIVTEDSKLDASGVKDEFQEQRRTKRFDDNIFNLLGDESDESTIPYSKPTMNTNSNFNIKEKASLNVNGHSGVFGDSDLFDLLGTDDSDCAIADCKGVKGTQQQRCPDIDDNNSGSGVINIDTSNFSQEFQSVNVEGERNSDKETKNLPTEVCDQDHKLLNKEVNQESIGINIESNIDIDSKMSTDTKEEMSYTTSPFLLEENGNIDHIRSYDGEIDKLQFPEMLSRLDVEVNSLLKELQHESHLLRQDLNKYQTGVDTLNALNQKIKDIEEESREIQADTVKEEKKSAASGLQLEAHEMSLLRDLRAVYPIRSLRDGYSICNLIIPPRTVRQNNKQNNSGNNSDRTIISDDYVDDVEICSALGFLCHLVVMCGKYLAVPFRYRIICKSSKSALMDDKGNIHPLFMEEKYMDENRSVDKGLELLSHNVDLLLWSKGINTFTNTSIDANAIQVEGNRKEENSRENCTFHNILAKLDLLFQRTLDNG